MKLVNTFMVAALVAGAVVTMTGISFAATYAYVNTAGEVRTTDASTPEAAIMMAPGIHMNSGVLLVDDASDTQVVGDNVSTM